MSPDRPNRRREPQQDRSRRTVERIVDAAARVLERDGYRAASTNRIAAEAGVSPGSLYQYFGDRDALLEAVTARFVARFEEQLVPALRRAVREDQASATTSVIDAVLAALEHQAPLLRALVARIPPERQAELTRAIRERVTDYVFGTLARQHVELSPAALDRLTWLVVEVAQSLPLRYVVDAPPIPREAFVADVARLVLAHVAGVVADEGALPS